MPTLESQERRFALALFFPALAVLLLITTAPLVYLGWNSLHRLDLGHAMAFGFGRLGQLAKMGSDPRFWNSLLLTVIYTGSTVVLQVVVGLSLALLVLQIPKGQGLLRVAAILPIVLAPVVVGLFWRTLVLAPDFGLVDLVTRALGLGSHNWLGDPQLALISVIAIHTWQWTPFAFLVLLATLATLPPDVYEAARLDRAGAWQRFRHITLPLIRPAVVMVVILRMMTALSAFAAIFAATGGGPGSATEILNLYAYRCRSPSCHRLRLRRWRWCFCHDARHLGVCSAGTGGMNGRRAHRKIALRSAAALHWSFPVMWGSHVVQDRARRARLSADDPVRADARELPRRAIRRDRILPNLVSSMILPRRRPSAPCCSQFPRLRARPARAACEARDRLLRAGDADAAAGRPGHPVLPDVAQAGLDGQLSRAWC